MENNGNEKSKILVIGGTGRIGRHIVKASVNAGHQTFMLVRKTSPTFNISSDQNEKFERDELLTGFKNDGVTILYGDIYDVQSLVSATKRVDIVISAMGHGSKEQLADQINIINAIKEVGNIKRFIPSEFGCDVEHANLLEPAKSLLATKVNLRRIIRDEGIPHTIICNNLFHGFFIPKLGDPEATPPINKAFIFGDGNTQAIFVNEEDIATYTIKAIDDPRTMNKIVYLRPLKNFYSLNELVSLREQITGKDLEKIYIPEHELLKKIQESPFPLNFQLAMAHSSFIEGDHTKEIDNEVGLEATDLYPEIKYKTVVEFMNEILA